MRNKLFRLATSTIVAGVMAGIVVNAMPQAAMAETATENFESFTLGSPNQHDWQFAGPHDVAIADPSDFSVSGMGSKALRISNASTSDAFGDWAFSKGLESPAGELDAASDGLTGPGDKQPHFEASFKITSAQAEEQPGLQFSLAPDRGDGARMSFLRFNDTPGGIDVTFSNYLDRHVLGDPNSLGDPNGCDDPADNFVAKTIATDLNRAQIHDVKFTMDFLPGPANDRVEVYIDGALAGTGTSWEDYYRYCEGNPTRPVDSLIFQARSGAGTAPATLGKGFLIDALNLQSGPIVDPTTDGDWTLYPEQTVSTRETVVTDTQYRARVQQPINTDGSSNWPKKRGVIPVKFELDASTETTTTTTTTAGPVAFESILSDETDANDYSFLKFVPNAPLAFTDLTELTADYAFLLGDCHGGSLRWQVTLDKNNDAASDGAVQIYYGNAPQFGNGGTGGCTPASIGGIDQSGHNLIGLSDVRYDTTQLSGSFYDTYGGALSLIGEAKVLRASLVLDSGWQLPEGDQRVELAGATSNGSDYTPVPQGEEIGDPVVTVSQTPFARTCALPPARLRWAKNDPTPDGAVNEGESIQPNDTGEFYRNVDCKYIYNLDVTSLGSNPGTRGGTYRVWVNIDGENLLNPGKFDLK